jgi:large subunit ribosomal protein L1
MKKSGKKYVEASNKVERNKLYTKEEAIKLVKDTSITNFDGTVEVAFKLNLDTRKADQQLRGSMVLPHGTGKTKKVLVIAKGEAASEAKKAGADFVGEQDMIDKIAKENWFDYDVIVATPDMMVSLGKIGRVLGPKGLMPNPKTGTVTPTPAKAVEDIKKGMVSYKTDSYGNVHTVIGKVSFAEDKLLENLDFVYNTINKSKPTVVKGKFIENITISSTMGPGIKLDRNSFDN